MQGDSGSQWIIILAIFGGVILLALISCALQKAGCRNMTRRERDIELGRRQMTARITRIEYLRNLGIVGSLNELCTMDGHKNCCVCIHHVSSSLYYNERAEAE